MTQHPDLPLLHEDDSYLVELEGDDLSIRILRVLVFPNNVDQDPKIEQFFDMDDRARRAVIQQINRRYPGKMVKV